MANLYICVFVIAGITLSNAAELPEYKAGRLIYRPNLARVVVSANDQCKNADGSIKVGQFCSLNDCDTLLSCDANGGSFVPCSTMSTKNKYCSNNACSDKMPTDKACITNSFTCNAIGYLPDNANCALYYYCRKVGAEAWQYDCETNYAFDIKTSQCKRRVYSTDCALMTCKAGFTGFVIYTPDKSIYTFCNSAAGTASVGRCEDELYHEFDLTIGNCKKVCKAAGNQVNRYKCTSYDYCYLSGATLVMEERACPPNMYFNPTSKICVTGTCVNELPFVPAVP